MINFARFAKMIMRHGGLDSPDFDDFFPKTSRAVSGLATSASLSPKRAGLAQLGSQRLALLIEAQQARARRQSHLTSLIEADLRAVTLDILRRHP